MKLIEYNNRRHTPAIIRSFAYFVYILCLFFTSCDHRHICWHSTSHVYISEATVIFIYTTWPRGNWSRRHICLHISFVYLFYVKVRFIYNTWPSGHWPRSHICWHSTSFVYISEVKVRFIYTTSPTVGRLTAIFVDILRHDFINHRRHICFHTASFVYISEVKVRFIYTTWPRVPLLSRLICWHTTSFIYISEDRVRFIYTTWPPGVWSAAVFVDMWRHKFFDPAAMFVYFTWLWRHFLFVFSDLSCFSCLFPSLLSSVLS